MYDDCRLLIRTSLTLVGCRVQIYGPLFANKVPRLFHAVCSPMMPGPWLPAPSLSPGAPTAQAAVSGDDRYTPRSTYDAAGSAVSARLRAGRPASSSPLSARQTESMAETASRLLFCLVSWVSRIPSFSALAYSDQVQKLHSGSSHKKLSCRSQAAR